MSAAAEEPGVRVSGATEAVKLHGSSRRGLRWVRRLRWPVVWFLVMWLLSKPAALLAISAYQRFISPHKGWRCAHAVLHGGASCSAYGKAAISAHGVIQGGALLWRRFGDCERAALWIAAQSSGAQRCGKQCGEGCAQGCTSGCRGASQSGAPLPPRPPAPKPPGPVPKVSVSTPSLKPILAFPLPGSFSERVAARQSAGLYHFRSQRRRDGKLHTGVDWPANNERDAAGKVIREPVYAADMGTVSGIGDVASNKPWGKLIVVEHDGLTTGYAHVRPLPNIEQGRMVAWGEQIGVVEDIDVDPAHPDEPVPDHLHFEIRMGDKTRMGIGYMPPGQFDEKFVDPETQAQYLSVIPPVSVPVKPLPRARRPGR